MAKEKILLIGDSLEGPTGFANDLAGVSWSLAEKFDVHVLGLQSVNNHRVNLNIEGSNRSVTQHANFPRSRDKWDFGKRSLPRLLDDLEPDILLTVNDIQMVEHIPSTMCPNSINLQLVDIPSKKFLSEEALLQEMRGEVRRFKEKFPRTTKWIQYAPQDGDPPMGLWYNIYKMANQVVAMSDYGKDVFKKFFNMDVPRIWHGVDTTTFMKRARSEQFKDKFIVGNMNRNQPRKQPVRSMIAFAKFAKDKGDVFLHYQMDWNDEFGWPIQYFAGMYQIQNKMIPPQRVGMSRNQVAETYNMWDLNLMTTAGEGFGLPTIEAGACGVPTLGTDYTTSKELIIDGEPTPRGSLVKVKDLHWQKMDVAAVRRALIDVDDLTNLLNKYYYNRDLGIQHGKNAEIWCKTNCSWKVIGQQWQDLVEKTLSGDKA